MIILFTASNGQTQTYQLVNGQTFASEVASWAKFCGQPLTFIERWSDGWATFADGSKIHAYKLTFGGYSFGCNVKLTQDLTLVKPTQEDYKIYDAYMAVCEAAGKKIEELFF